MNYLKLENKILDWYKKIPSEIKKSVVYSFIIINFAFLFHSVNFMFGDHDWLYVRGASKWNEGAFEGRPFHFILQNLLFNGQVLPILNNFISFLALSLSGVILAKYWKIPVSTLNYTLFSSFVAVLPYTLVWLYYAKDTLINLSLPFIAILALYISDIAQTIKKKYLRIISIALLVFAFSSYIAIINYIGICFLGSIMLSYAFENKGMYSIIKQKIYTALDVVVSLVIFVLLLKIFPPASGYNTNLISLDFIFTKLKDTLVVMISQFVVTLPFMEYKYKWMLLISSVIGFVILLKKGGFSKVSPQILLFLLVLFVSKFTYFISDQRGELLTQMEDFAFVPRLDFYSLPYVYALCLSPIFFLKKSTLKKSLIVLLVLIIFMSIVRVMNALP